MNTIEINAAIFPKIMMIALGKPMEDNNKETLLAPIDAAKLEIMRCLMCCQSIGGYFGISRYVIESYLLEKEKFFQ